MQRRRARLARAAPDERAYDGVRAWLPDGEVRAQRRAQNTQSDGTVSRRGQRARRELYLVTAAGLRGAVGDALGGVRSASDGSPSEQQSRTQEPFRDYGRLLRS